MTFLFMFYKKTIYVHGVSSSVTIAPSAAEYRSIRFIAIAAATVTS